MAKIFCTRNVLFPARAGGSRQTVDMTEM